MTPERIKEIENIIGPKPNKKDYIGFENYLIYARTWWQRAAEYESARAENYKKI